MPRLWPLRALFSICVLLPILALISCGSSALGGGNNAIIPPFNSYTSCAVADFNGDGKPDIAVAYSTVSAAPPHPGFLAVYLQDPAHAGQFLPPSTYDVGNDPVALVAGDLNGDGKLDLVSVNTILNASGTGDSSVSVLLQDPTNAGKFLAAVNYPTGFSPVSVAIGDLNGDGRPDLAVSDTTGISILLQSSTAAGQFLPLTTIAVPNGGTSSVAIVDLNRDGKPDLIATATDLNIFMQNPTSPGNFLPPAHYMVGAQPISIAVEDFNADGHLDLAIANLGSPDGTTTPASVSVLLQNPAAAGNFLPAANYATGTYSLMIAAADLNSDGNPDLVVANMGTYTGGTVSVLLQDSAGAGAFLPATDYPDSGPVSWIAAADLDGDGRNDLVIASNSLEIRFQDSANPGTFLGPVMLTPQ